MRKLSSLTMQLVCILLASVAAVRVPARGFGEPYPLEVLASQTRRMTDDQTGVELLFLSSGPSDNENLYFHERSWFQDNSVVLYHARGEYDGLMGYIVATGELVRLTSSSGTPLNGGTAVLHHPGLYAMADGRALEVVLDIQATPGSTSKVWARERQLCEIQNAVGSLNESCDGRLRSVGVTTGSGPESSSIMLMPAAGGQPERLCGMPPGAQSTVSHVQWSMTNPYWLSFANGPIRIWVVDIRDGTPWAPYAQRPGELVTHEAWWVNDLMLFCGGIHPKPQEDAHVKTLNPRTGEVRIIGEGAWWPEATAVELAKRNWWHPAGSPDGHWVAADNWHGDIMLFEGLTARPRLLTQGHRTYGGGEHPEVGWDRRGEQVIFASHKLGEGVHACVATIPAGWQATVRQLGRRIESMNGN